MAQAKTLKSCSFSLKAGTKNPQIAYNAKVGLAEYYYNEKKYNTANIYYEDVLKDPKNEWYSKHLYNSSWCHLKERNFKKALSLIKEAYQESNKKQNEGVKSQILNAIGIFFVQADAAIEGVDFYLKNAKPASTYLVSLAKSSRSKNDFPLTDSIYKTALINSIQEKNSEQEISIRLEQLEFYREHKKTDLFVATAKELVQLNKKNKMSSENISAISNKIKELAGFMQVNLVKDKLQEVITFNKEDYNKIIILFDLLASLDKENRSLYRYYQGETAFSVADFKSANVFYSRSIMITKKTKKITPQTIKTIDSLLTSIEHTKLSKGQEDRLTIFALKNYLIFYPISDRSQKIYQKLFSKYFTLKQYKRAINIALVYHDKYLADQAIHKEMITQVLDAYIKTKDIENLTTWVNIIDKGFLHFPDSFIQNSIVVLGSLLFEKNQQLEKSNKLKEARAGYKAIFDSKFYPQKIKSEAAYAISSVYLQENNSQDSIEWFKKSVENYPKLDLMKTTSSIYNLAKGHRLLQNFKNSTEVSKTILTQFCTSNFEKKDDFYELILINSLLEKVSIKNILKLETEYSKCKISENKISQIQTDILLILITDDQYENLFSYIKSRELNENSKKMVHNYLHFKFWQDPKGKIEEFNNLTSKYPALTIDTITSEYDALVAYKEKVENVKFIFSSEDKFNDEKYNSELEQYLAILNDLTNDAVKLSKTASLEVVSELQNIIPTPYTALNKSILNFQPKGVDAAYLKGFNQGMRQISESLSAKILQFDREKMMFFDKNHFFFEVKFHAKLGTEKTNIEQILDFHPSLLHSKKVELSGEKK